MVDEKPSHVQGESHQNDLAHGLDASDSPTAAHFGGGEKQNLKTVDLERETESSDAPRENLKQKSRRLIRRWKPLIHIFIWMLVTTWWIVGLVIFRRYNWVEPMLLWMLISFRLITFYIPARYALIPLQFVWRHSMKMVKNVIPEHYRSITGAAVVTVALVLGVFIPEETSYNRRSDRAVSVFGYLVFLSGLYITSRHRKRINWKPVVVGILAQFIMGFFVLRTTLGKTIFRFLSQALTTLLTFAYDGVFFLTDKTVLEHNWFLVNSLSIFVFFVALVQMGYYVGFIQWIVTKLAYCFGWAFSLSGAEALVAGVTPFLGMGEAAIIVKGFIPQLTRAEIHQVMTAGFSTISGSLMVVYIGLGANGPAVISSCLMSIPISIAISKMRVPETEEPLTLGHVSILNNEPEDEISEANILHAMANGAWTGLKVAGLVAANLIAIISLVALCDGILQWCFKYIGAPNVTLSQIFGYFFYPVAFLMGAPRHELYLVGQLIGQKTIQNEFVAFAALTQEPKFTALSLRGNIIATYAICGFANIGSIGIQLGIYGQLSPKRRGDFAKEALSACICGALATFMSASLAGMIFAG